MSALYRASRTDFISFFLFFHPFWLVNCDFSQFSLKLQETKTFFFANHINGHFNICLTQEVNTIYRPQMCTLTVWALVLII